MEWVRTSTPVLARRVLASDRAMSLEELEETEPAVLETMSRREPGYWARRRVKWSCCWSEMCHVRYDAEWYCKSPCQKKGS